jgi:hypothetical protein
VIFEERWPFWRTVVSEIEESTPAVREGARPFAIYEGRGQFAFGKSQRLSRLLHFRINCLPRYGMRKSLFSSTVIDRCCP